MALKKNFRIASTLLLPVLMAFSSRAQEKNYSFSGGIEYAISTYSAGGKLDLSGQGIFLQGERFFSRQKSDKAHQGFSAVVSIGWLHFSGPVGILDTTFQSRFSVLPVLGGAKYYWKDRYYLGMQAGALVSTNSQTETHLALAPSIGMVAPVGQSMLELSLRFTGVPMGFGYPEKTVLQRGGYSFAALRIAYIF